MRPPPERLEGALVLFWAASQEGAPFFDMPTGDASVAVHGLAICRSGEAGPVYRFACDRSWEVLNDAAFRSPEEAMAARSAQYDVTRVRWRATES